MVKGLRRWWHGEDDGFDAVETFRRLYTYERVTVLILCVLVCAVIMGGMLSSNLAPHFKALFDADGHLNTGELTSCLMLSGSVFLITFLSYFLYARWLSFPTKALMIVATVLILHGNIKNSAGIQARDHEVKNTPFALHNKEIDTLNAEIPGLLTTWRSLESIPSVTDKQVADDEKALNDARASADFECHFGEFGRTRGPKCDARERERDRQSAELSLHQQQAADVKRRSSLEIEIRNKRARLAELGEKFKSVDPEQATVTAFYNDVGATKAAEITSKHDAMIEAITLDLKVVAFLWPALMAIFRVFAAISANRAVAEDRISRLVEDVADNHARIVLGPLSKEEVDRFEDDAPPYIGGMPKPEWLEKTPQDDEPEAVLEVDGRDTATLVENPSTDAERIAAAIIRNDPDRPKKTGARKRVASPDTVPLWYKKRCITRHGRQINQADLYTDYLHFCEETNLTPETQEAFGKMLRNEFKLQHNNKKGGRYQYIGVGLRPNLRIVGAA